MHNEPLPFFAHQIYNAGHFDDHSLQKVTIQVKMSPRLLSTLIALLLALSRARSACEDSQLSVGFFYSCQLTGEDFFVGGVL